MLSRLLKYEIKATARIFLPLYAVLLIFALLNRFINPFQAMEAADSFNLQATLKMLSVTAYFVLIVAVFVMTLVITIQRFYKNLLGDEGYLMFTLPVKPWQHITSKLVTAMMWYILSTAAIAFSILILVGFKEVFDFLPQLIQMIKDGVGYYGFVMFPILALLQLAAGTMMIYDAIALGHLFSNKHRLLTSFAMYCVLYAIQQVLLVIFIFTFGNTFFASIIHSSMPTLQQVNMFITFLGIIAVLLIAAHFAVINYVLRRKLNLE
jgi:hypothetical protein